MSVTSHLRNSGRTPVLLFQPVATGVASERWQKATFAPCARKPSVNIRRCPSRRGDEHRLALDVVEGCRELHAATPRLFVDRSHCGSQVAMRLDQRVGQGPDLVDVELGRGVRVEHRSMVDMLAALLHQRRHGQIPAR